MVSTAFNLHLYTKEAAYKLDFDLVPIGQQVVREVKVKNETEQEVSVRAAHLDHEGTFSVVNALRAIAPGAVAVVKVDYHPTSRAKSFDVLTLHTSLVRRRRRLTPPSG